MGKTSDVPAIAIWVVAPGPVIELREIDQIRQIRKRNQSYLLLRPRNRSECMSLSKPTS